MTSSLYLVSFSFHFNELCILTLEIMDYVFPFSVMFERLVKNGRDFENQTKEHLHEYADAGLRTLVLAYRELNEQEYMEFNDAFSEAKNSVSADRDARVDEIVETIEKDLILLGATAVEDKLQSGVS